MQVSINGSRNCIPFLRESTSGIAMQADMGFSRIVILVGAGYTGTLLIKNGKLSDVLGELQGYVGKEGGGAEGDYSGTIASQLASSHQIIVLNGGCAGNMTFMVVPAAALGAVGYGYMWWKSNMANAVLNLTKNLEQVTNAIAAAKRHLTQRIENLDGKLDDQVTNVRGDVSQIGYDLDSLNKMISGLNGKIITLEEKQVMTNLGVWYLADGNKLSGTAKEQFKLAGKSFGGHSGGFLSIDGVKERLLKL
ncbi:hypothetical protein LXL04_025592 [Taraxacum kok-saghyz]